RPAPLAGLRRKAGTLQLQLRDDLRCVSRSSGRRSVRLAAAGLDGAHGGDLRGPAGDRVRALPRVSKRSHDRRQGLLEPALPASAGRGPVQAVPGRTRLRRRAGRGLLALLRRVRRGLGRNGPLGRLLRHKEEAGPGKLTVASVQSSAGVNMPATIGRTVALRVLPSRWAEGDTPDLAGGPAFPVAAAQPADGESALVFPAGYVPGHSAAILDLYEQMRVLVRGDVPVLFLGET